MENALQPVYVLRGHASAVHVVHFYQANLRLLSADAEGWVVVWDVPSRRPVAVWKAHDAAVLGVRDWQHDKILTHGRDNKLYVWRLSEDDVPLLSTRLPATSSLEESPRPAILHSLDVNALNFCPFSMCFMGPMDVDGAEAGPTVRDDSTITLAVAGSQRSDSIDLYQLPSGVRSHAAVGAQSAGQTGLPMSLSLLRVEDRLILGIGYESGLIAVLQEDAVNCWSTIAISHLHSQPVLSLDCYHSKKHPARVVFYSSAADAKIVKQSINTSQDPPTSLTWTHDTAHAGQQGLQLRSDGKIFATAGWDSKIRIFAAKSLEEVAVLKWHKEGCYTVSFGQILEPSETPQSNLSSQDDQGVERFILEDSASPDARLIARADRARATHWLAAGSKDGKITLWSIF